MFEVLNITAFCNVCAVWISDCGHNAWIEDNCCHDNVHVERVEFTCMINLGCFMMYAVKMVFFANFESEYMSKKKKKKKKKKKIQISLSTHSDNQLV